MARISREQILESSFQAQLADRRLPGENIRSLVLSGKLLQPKVGIGLPIPYRGNLIELQALIEKTVETVLAKTDYNGLAPYIKLLSNKQRFLNMRIDSIGEEGRSTCTGNSLHLMKVLRERHAVEGSLALERKVGGSFCHAAALFECADGYLLIDPLRLNNKPPIAIIPFGKQLETSEKRIVAARDRSTIPIRYTKGADAFEYCRDIGNGEDIVLKHFMVKMPFCPIIDFSIPILTYNERGDRSKMMFVSLLKETIVLKDLNAEQSDPDRTVTVSFREVEQNLFHPKLEHFYHKHHPFQIPFEQLSAEISTFVKHKKTFANLYASCEIKLKLSRSD